MERTDMGPCKQGPRGTTGISVAIPAYSRCQELTELLQSIYEQTLLPSEITICEDKSPEREGIRRIVESWRGWFETESCSVNYHENEVNLGYDANLRKVIAVSHSPWVMLMGNDDLLMPGCIETAAQYLAATPQVRMISRSFVMFEGSRDKPLGVSRLTRYDQVFVARKSSPAMLFRTCGFVSGLIVNRPWADELATDDYDGSLYYQIYLAAVAFCESGIGYISTSIIANRAHNPPLFGSAAPEK